MDKAMDFESEGVCVHVRFPAWATFLLFYEDNGGATRSGAGERRRAGMSAANVGDS